MDLVDVDGAAVRIEIFPFSHPLLVLPAIARKIVEFGCVCRCGLEVQAVGVALEHGHVVLSRDRVFVRLILLRPCDKRRPNAVILLCHDVCVCVPIVEITHNGYALCVGSPHRKLPAVNAAFDAGLGREHLLRLIIRPFVEQITCVTILAFCHCFLLKTDFRAIFAAQFFRRSTKYRKTNICARLFTNRLLQYFISLYQKTRAHTIGKLKFLAKMQNLHYHFSVFC